MKATRIVIVLTFTVVVIFIVEDAMVESMSTTEKKELREKVLEMFNHAYGSYMQNAFPADELMPLSCKGRYRGTEPSRGDVDDSLGNFTLTLIDSLDTLVVLGELEQFDNAVRLVIQYAKFDSDVIVSVFETNIRILGGLLGGHVVASYLKRKKKAMEWYNEELLNMAKDVGYKLLPAFNTTTGIPYPRINLKYGMKKDNLADRHRDTCTACAGTMILEFAALTRLTGDPIFEEKAHKAMDYLWEQRHRTSDLVGTVINVHNGDWVRRESGVGAGIDSYYEYVLKAYVLLGDDRYLNRFNKHYTAIMKYISQGPMLVDVHMHKPNSASKNFMDALLAFWPGLQVLKGDIRPAIETHEMLYQVIQRHNFLPEAFTTDFRVHWGQHPLRPEFLESTYFLYKATGDPHYLQVGKHVLENLNTHARVPCGFASLKDVVSGKHEDQLDSYVLAETFKYLYLLFSEKSDLVLNIDDYIFTTEAHLLPLSLSVYNTTSKVPKINREVYRQMEEFTYDTYPEVEDNEEKETDDQVCPNPANLHRGVHHYAYNLRTEMKGMVDKANPQMASCQREKPRLKAVEFIAGNKAQLEMLNKMGIRIATMSDGRVQLLHSAADAATPLDAEDGMKFMQEMIELSKNQQQDNVQEPMTVQFISEPYWGSVHIRAGPAQFGYSLKINPPVQGQIAVAEPYSACSSIANPTLLEGKIAIVERGNCMFIDKARNIQNVGAIGGIVIDNNVDSTSESSPIFAMSGDGRQDVKIPMVFLFHKEGQDLLQALAETLALTVLLSQSPKEEGMFQPFYGADPAEPETKEPDSTVEVHGPNKLSENSGSGSSEHVSSTEQTSELPSEIDQNEWIKVKVNNQALNKDELVEEANGGMEYRLQAGTGTVQMDVKVSSKTSQEPKSPGVIDDDVIILKTLPDGSKELSFRFDKISKSVPKTKPELNQIYVDLVDILQRRTNFNSLGRPGDYLIAIARLLESAYFNLESVDREAQKMFDKLANELEIINPEVKDPQSQFNDNQSPEEAEDQTNYNFQKPITDADEGLPQNTKGEFQHYATPEELAGASSALPGQVPNIESETTVTFHDLTQSQENILTQENSINSFESEKSESRAENSINTQKNGNYGKTNKNSEKTENQNRRSNDEL